ncbi:ferrochelatase, mitochondrial [Cloeon dipterum]|uniref:ferrochelatase, mitochondrial n=1 Tax=Cloeon dipterum TaxID=197152 RepID=UPI00321FE030
MEITRLSRRLFSTASVLRNAAETNRKVKTGVLMINMGGPEKLDQVHDYLLGIMTDRDMIQLPVQSKLGPWIAKRRTPEVQKKYSEIGGGSPILKWTNRQGELMCKKLNEVSKETGPHKHYVAFRYVTPFIDDAIEAMKKDGVEHVVAFSQYPQYSCATSGSSFNAIFDYAAKNKGIAESMKWSVIDRWSTNPLLAKVFADRIRTELNQIPEDVRHDTIILFSAHSLPLKAVQRGDPYPSEVGSTVQMVMNELNHCNPFNLVWQSKVGPLPWLGPFTDEALEAYVKKGKKNFILVPIAFVNEHIETLHELDIEYCHDLGKKLGVQNLRRAAAPNDHPLFIDALTDLVQQRLKSTAPGVSPKFLTRCPHCVNARCGQTKKWFAELCGARI